MSVRVEVLASTAETSAATADATEALLSGRADHGWSPHYGAASG
jgi:hypothetical protein